ncbi:MAG: GldG family protein [Candidatus Eisenbacteria bacterium]|nr:GldG family protein [Candidatus Eisenbacteria bacterium]MCC7141057.1 GldG family protein [Candidatus Eisenbacteria bacterium]
MADKKERVLKYGVNSGLAVLIMAGILIAANVIGTQVFGRLDLTEGREFTISPSTKNILRRLDDVVTVKCFFSKKLPPQLANLEQQVADLLKEYEVYSKGNLNVRFFDPGTSEDLKGQARTMNIPELQMNVLEKDQYQVSNVYLGIGLQYGDKVEAIPVVEDVSNLEYDLSAAIVKLTRKEEPSLGFLSGNGERTLDRELEGIKRTLETQYEVRAVDLGDGQVEVPTDIKTLIVAGSKNVAPREAYQIDQFIMRGGKAVFLVDPITMNEQMGLAAMPARSGLDELLGHYGVGIKSALVLDPRCESATFSQGYMAYQVRYPLWPSVSQQLGGLNLSNPITAGLEAVTLPWTAPLEVNLPIEADTKSKEPSPVAGTNATQPNVKAVVLAKSTDKAWTQEGRYELNPQALMTQPVNQMGQSMPLAVLASGRFGSLYAGRPVPPATAAAEGTPTSTDTPLTESPETQILVIGSSSFVTNQFLRMYPANALLLQNALDFLASGDDLIAIRSRGATERPLKELSSGAKAALKYLNTLGIAALVVVFGLIRRVARRNARERLGEIYGKGGRHHSGPEVAMMEEGATR